MSTRNCRHPQSTYGAIRENPMKILPRLKWALTSLFGLVDAVGLGVTSVAGIEVAVSPSRRRHLRSGGEITRSEVIDRTQYWVDKRITYDTNSSAADPSGRPYRRDCSELISMAWHLAGNPGRRESSRPPVGQCPPPGAHQVHATSTFSKAALSPRPTTAPLASRRTESSRARRPQSPHCGVLHSLLLITS
jgi:hypothetical protein